MFAQRAYAVFFALILSLLSHPSWSLGLNLALPANGGVATASSTHSPSFPVSGANNGDRKGANWGAGGGWNDGTASIYPDWLQITFNGQKNIEQIDLFTVQDNYTNPIEPTASLSFTQYGLKNFEVQYWNGTSWLTIPGGSVSNNTLIWRKFTFPAISTDRIRIHISNALAGYSRITELEIYEAGGVANTPPIVNLSAPANNTNYTAPASITINASATDSDGSITQVEFYNGATLLNTDTSAPYSYTWNNIPQGNYSLTARATDNQGASSTSTPININVNPAGGQAKNLALPSNGGVATASSTYSSNFPVSGINNGDRKGTNWGNGGGWNDATASVYPDWVQINFNGQKNINKIDLFTVQDNYTNPIEPTASTSFTQYGLKNFEVQYWNGTSWLTIPGGSVSNNTLIWRSFSFTSINTDRIRIYISNALAGYSRITELEVYEAAAPANVPPTISFTNPANNASYTAPATITLDANATDSDGSVTQVEFYNGTTLINTDTSAPYSYTWNNVPAGNYSLTAKATDNSGANTTSTAVNVSVIAAAPTVTLSANPQSIVSGASSTLTWVSTNATSCTASGAWNGSKTTSGNQSTGALTTTSTYTLACTGAGGSANQSTTVTVTPAGGVSTLSGMVDTSLIANLKLNSIYLYAGNVTPDDVGGVGAQPLKVVAVTQDRGACSWRYNAGSLADGEYTLAFTTQTANDNPAVNDAITFQRVALVNVSGGVSSYNFAAARVLTVGVGKAYPNVMAAAAAVQAGDVIEIDAGQYNDNIVVWRANDLTLRGVGGRAHMHATKLIPYTGGNDLENGKGLWVTRGNNIKVENIEFSNAAVPDKNGAGIRAEGLNLNVCNGYFHNNENGMLGGGGEMLVEYSEFAYNGGCAVGFGCAHNLYITGADKLVFQHNYSHHANIGHLLKSRAKENHILYNRLTGESGTASYEVDIPDGGLTYLVGNLIQQGALTDNSNMVAYALESASNPLQQLFAVNNTLVNERGSGTAILIRAGTTAQVINNLFVGNGTSVSGPATQTTNLTSNTPNFVNQASYDYRLTSASPGINGGSNPGSNAGFALAPAYQYVHPINREVRNANGTLDIGAYEFTSANPLPTVALSASPLSVISGASSNLTWSSTNATSCTASGAWSGARAIAGAETINNISSTSTFTLTCSGAGGSASQSVTVTVTAGTPAPTVSLSANPASVSSGGSSTLTWSSTNASACTASGAWSGSQLTSGNQSTGALNASSTYTLTCTGNGGSATQSVNVMVGAGPVAITSVSIVNNNANAAQTNVPITFGQVFAVGDVPSGSSVTGVFGNGAAIPLQVNVKATHADGSVRHAIISAVIPSLASGQTETISLVSTTMLATAPITPAALLAAGFTSRIDVTVAGVLYTASADTLLAGPNTQWLNGPIVNEWLVSAPLKTALGVAHPHLTARFAIRSYAGSNKTKVDVTVENSRTFTTDRRNIIYDSKIFVGGVEVDNIVGLNHFRNARWHKSFWYGTTEPLVHLKHNTAYLIATKAVSNYDQTVVPSESAIAELATTISGHVGPMKRGLLTYDGMGTGGGRPDIGPLPGWYVLYLLSMDKRAKDAMLATADTGGSWPIHFRDETVTGTLANPSTGTLATLASDNKTFDMPVRIDKVGNAANGNPYTYITTHENFYNNNGPIPDMADGTACRQYDSRPECIVTLHPDTAHQPSMAYLPYLVTGDYFYLEELQFWAAWNFLGVNGDARGDTLGLVYWDQVRGQGWSMRTMGHAAYITPDTHPLKTYFKDRVINNINYYDNRYRVNTGAKHNQLGVTLSYWDEPSAKIRPWMDDFFTWSIGYLVELGFTEAQTFLPWKSKFVIGRMTPAVTPSDYCWLMASAYTISIRPTNTDPMFTTFADVYAKTFGVLGSDSTTLSSKTCASPAMAAWLAANSTNTGIFSEWLSSNTATEKQMFGYPDQPIGTPANMQPALAVSVSAANPAWTTFMSRDWKPDYTAQPQFAIVPRN